MNNKSVGNLLGILRRLFIGTLVEGRNITTTKSTLQFPVNSPVYIQALLLCLRKVVISLPLVDQIPTYEIIANKLVSLEEWAHAAEALQRAFELSLSDRTLQIRILSSLVDVYSHLDKPLVLEALHNAMIVANEADEEHNRFENKFIPSLNKRWLTTGEDFFDDCKMLQAILNKQKQYVLCVFVRFC